MKTEELPTNPINLFATWMADASHLPLHNGVTVATVGADGQPSARVVLLRGHDEQGFVFYTNYESRKARDMEANPRAALLFWWRELGRQIRIEGRISRDQRGVGHHTTVFMNQALRFTEIHDLAEYGSEDLLAQAIANPRQ